MSDPEGRFDVVVVAYDSRDEIAGCLASVQGAEGLGMVVVVDHGSDGSADVAAATGATVVRDPSNPGFGAGHNGGVGRTTAPAVLLLNPDARLVPGAVAQGLTVLGERTGVAAVQGVVLDADSGDPERSAGVALGPAHLWGRALRLRSLLGWGPVRRLAGRVPSLSDHVDRVPDTVSEVESLAATALLVRRSAFDEVSGFDERYFLYGEDVDLCRRLRGAGWTLVALPVPWATHRAGSSHRSEWRREVQWWRGTMIYAARWYDPRAWTSAVGAAVVRAVTLAVRRPRRAGDAWQSMVAEPRRVRRTTHGEGRGRPHP